MSVTKQNTLCLLLKAVQGRETTVELRNEAIARGVVEEVDDTMNLSMENVEFTRPDGRSAVFPSLFVHGRQIRYVHIPDDIDMIQAIKDQMKKELDRRFKVRQLNTRKAAQTRKLRQQLVEQAQRPAQ